MGSISLDIFFFFCLVSCYTFVRYFESTCNLQDQMSSSCEIVPELFCFAGEIIRDSSELEFEAKSSEDGAW